jgi:drug/metabolite transporter (DMT)-like permease
LGQASCNCSEAGRHDCTSGKPAHRAWRKRPRRPVRPASACLTLSPSLISTLQLIIGGSGVLLAGLIFDFPPKIYGLKNWMILIYIALASMVIYSIVWNNILKVMRSYEASILGSSTIIYTTLLAMLILKERLLLHQWIGMGTMVVGLLLVQERRGNLKELYLKMKKKDKKQINR